MLVMVAVLFLLAGWSVKNGLPLGPGNITISHPDGSISASFDGIDLVIISRDARFPFGISRFAYRKELTPRTSSVVVVPAWVCLASASLLLLSFAVWARKSAVSSLAGSGAVRAFPSAEDADGQPATTVRSEAE